MKLLPCVDIKGLYLRSRSSTDSELKIVTNGILKNLTKLLRELNKTWDSKQILTSYNKT